MSVRTPIQVPEELKAKVDDLKEPFRSKTHYEVIEKLIESHNSFVKYKEDQRLKDQREKDRQRKESVDLGEETKTRLIDFMSANKFRNEAAVINFLLHHYEKSQSIDKSTLELYQDLIK
ncbi:hypothetical protein [Paenibacillus tuaregi]|uniref:hypothetical protein n=1 Tax=Paenibacillus tuaregi TaxID=1816681 RepID=UPI000839AE92|nr:hypothetical protein [Paenibacillus tuaregi]